jgi:uncharacterized membrane protein
MQKWVVISVLLLLTLPFTLAATLHGRVFDYSFKVANNSVVSINTVPDQTMVAVDGSYSFNVPPGQYIISAYLNDAFNTTIYFVEDNASVVDDGDYVLDLIMFPSGDLSELDLEDDINGSLSSEQTVQVHKAIIVAVALVIIIIFIWLYCVAYKKCGVWNKIRSFVIVSKEEAAGKNEEKKPEQDKQVLGEESDDLADLNAFIMKHKRVTQKEIRKEFPVSEAKISLMLTDLESQGKVKKIKKGRGNIIIYSGK